MRSAFSYMMSTRLHKRFEDRSNHIAAMTSKQKALVNLQQLISPTNERKLSRAHCFAIGTLLWAEVSCSHCFS